MKSGFRLKTSFSFENPDAKIGEGVSRPKLGAKTSAYRIHVANPKQGRMKVILHAETKRHARRYARNRWPDAIVDVMGRVNL